MLTTSPWGWVSIKARTPLSNSSVRMAMPAWKSCRVAVLLRACPRKLKFHFQPTENGPAASLHLLCDDGFII